MKNKKKCKFLIILLVIMMLSVAQSVPLFAVTVGDQLNIPEQGWQRIDDTDSNIVFKGNWTIYTPEDYTNTGYYKDTVKVSDDPQSSISFNFYGTNLRIIDRLYNNRSSNCLISLDNGTTWEEYSEYVEATEKTPRGIIVFEKKNLDKEVHSVIIKGNGIRYLGLDAIDIDQDGYMVPQSIEVQQDSINIDVNENKNLLVSISAGKYTPSDIVWKSSDEAIATVDQNGTVTGVKVGTATITAYIEGTELSDICTVNVTEVAGENPTRGMILNVEPENNTIKLNQTTSAAITIDNITNIAAEDIYVSYDAEKLEYLGCDEVDGIKLVYNDKKDGVLRFIVASKGEQNIVNAKKTLLNLKFKGILKGEALVDITRGRISDGIEMEEDVSVDKCGEATIIIEDSQVSSDDVNHSGEFTLLDLGIDARHLGKDPKSEELAKYNTDIVINEAIDDDDLLLFGKLNAAAFFTLNDGILI